MKNEHSKILKSEKSENEQAEIWNKGKQCYQILFLFFHEKFVERIFTVQIWKNATYKWVFKRINIENFDEYRNHNLDLVTKRAEK